MGNSQLFWFERIILKLNLEIEVRQDNTGGVRPVQENVILDEKSRSVE